MLENANKIEDSGPVKKESVFITQMPTLFPPQILNVDLLHTICLGLIHLYLDKTKIIYPKEYNCMKDLSNFLFIPRQNSSYIHNLYYYNNMNAKDFLFWFLNLGYY